MINEEQRNTALKEQANRGAKMIWVTFRKEGIHKYPDAPDGVEFLKYPHRHIFHFRVELEVFHDDRDVEFILLKGSNHYTKKQEKFSIN